MKVRYPTRLRDLLGAVRLSRELERHDQWSPEQLREHQRDALDALHAHARARSPLWRERLAAGPPILDKATVMGRFDDLACDPRVRLERVERHLAQLGSDDVLLDRDLRVMATSGATGHRVVFVNTRAEWRMRLANALRVQALIGLGPLPRRRVAIVTTTNPMHISARFAKSTDVGLHRVLALSAAQPLQEVAQALARFDPEQLMGYPSVVAMLAEEHRAGRVAVAPRTVMVGAEVLTEGMEAAIREAWPGVALQDFYATTEGGILAAGCEAGQGLHLFEDLAVFENVDAAGRPVPEGELGDALVMTDLVSRAQPRIRIAISDSVVLTSEPCPCGRPFRRITRLVGRTDDVLTLPGRAGGTVRVHPLVVRSALARHREVVQFAVDHEAQDLRVLVVPRTDADGAGMEQAVARTLRAAVEEAGATAQVEVRAVPELERDPGHGAKVRVVRSRAAASPLR